jgi:hypothetical protein
MPQMTREKRAVLRAVVNANRAGTESLTATGISEFTASPRYGIVRTARVLAGAGYLEQSGPDLPRYKATDKGYEYYDAYLAIGKSPYRRGRRPKLTEDDRQLARRLLRTVDGHGRRLTLTAVAKRLGVSNSALWRALHPEANEARNRQRREQYAKAKGKTNA